MVGKKEPIGFHAALKVVMSWHQKTLVPYVYTSSITATEKDTQGVTLKTSPYSLPQKSAKNDRDTKTMWRKHQEV